jgi:prepilin-type processing-associated H-X9-DG protein
LLPAVQKIREAGNRAQCQNNLKQIGLAMHNYHVAKRAFPPGTVNDKPDHWSAPRLTYMIFLYPYLEQDKIYRQFDQRPSEGTPDGYGGAIAWCSNSNCRPPPNPPPTTIVLEILLCPSDGVGATISSHIEDDGTLYGTWCNSNYLGFFGDKNYGGFFPGNPPNKKAVFGFNYGARLTTDIKDGASNTMAFGEYLRGLSHEYRHDHRGNHWSDVPAYSQLYTRFAPNSSNQDLIFPDSRCYNRPDLNLPCAGSTWDLTTAASRSRHPGGVNVLMADGSVRFIVDSINLATWQALGTIQGGEVLGDL